MNTRKYLILTASICLLLIAAINATLAQNNRAGQIINDSGRFERRASSSAAHIKTDGETVVPDSNGALDPTFGTGGRVITELPNDDFSRQIGIQPDGKIVVLGWTLDVAFNLIGTYLLRYNANGSLDTGFGVSGAVRNDCEAECFEDGFATLPDGKLLVAGDFYDATTDVFSFGVYRLNADGSRDTTWGINGVVKILADRGDSYGHEIVVQPDGKAVVFGFTRRGTTTDFDLAAVRLNSNGTPDNTFGTNGVFVTPVLNNAGFGRVPEVRLQPDGKFLFLVQASTIIGAGRINGNGTLDTAFGTNGFLSLNTTFNFSVQALTLQPDRKFVVVTSAVNGDAFQSTIARYNSNGTLDASFGTNGTLITSLADSFSARAVVIQSNGKIVVGGNRFINSAGRFALLRINPNGTIDNGFGNNGYVVTTIRGVDDYITTMAFQSDGKLVALGDIGVGLAEPYDIALARYRLDAPAPPPFFDFDGDGRDDVAVFRGGSWYRLNSSDNSFNATQWGLAADKITPADYDGDRRSDLAVFRNGGWFVLQSATNTLRAVSFGQAGDIPVPGDYDGDGKADVGVFRAGTWFILNSSNNSFRAEVFGVASDKPIVGDFDADGRQDLAVFRDGTWYVNRSTAGFAAAQFGLAADKPVAADYDGDAKTDFAVFRSGSWYILQTSNNAFRAVNFGLASDRPVPADYSGDGKTDVAVFREGNWFILDSQNNSFRAVGFGIATDAPLQTAYLP